MFHSFNLFLQTEPNFTSPKASTPFLSKLNFMTMKRGITELRELDHSLTMANCLMLLSRGTNEYESFSNMQSHNPIRVFECKTCNRQFPSFQALGGHRASHKKPRMTASGDGNSTSSDQSQSPSKPKTHECNVCGLEFAIGQALGGHMRRHRTANNLSSSTDHLINGHDQSNSFLSLSSPPPPPPPPPTQVVMKRANSSRRVFSLDLNLTPLENDMEILGLRKAAAPALSIVFSN